MDETVYMKEDAANSNATLIYIWWDDLKIFDNEVVTKNDIADW